MLRVDSASYGKARWGYGGMGGLRWCLAVFLDGIVVFASGREGFGIWASGEGAGHREKEEGREEMKEGYREGGDRERGIIQGVGGVE